MPKNFETDAEYVARLAANFPPMHPDCAALLAGRLVKPAGQSTVADAA